MFAQQEQSLIACDSLNLCPGLLDLVSLQELTIKSCFELGQLLDVQKLTNLRRLSIVGSNFTQVLGFNNSMILQELVVDGVEEMPDLHLLRHLQRLFVRNRMLQLPQFSDLITLEELICYDLPEVQELSDMCNLTRLRRLIIDDVPKLLKLPQLGDLVALQYLKITNCCQSGNAELLDLQNFSNLEVLDLSKTPIRNLPSLKCLTRLRELRCGGTLLTELPDLSGSKNWERIDLGEDTLSWDIFTLVKLVGR